MFKDYFTLHKIEDDLWVLRILNKVDFALEVVWAHAWDRPSAEDFASMASLAEAFLEEGPDCVCDWSGNEETWHNSIQHLGMTCVSETKHLVPMLLKGMPADGFNSRFGVLINERKEALRDVLVYSEVGPLWEAVTSLGVKVEKPRVPTATAEIPLRMVFDRDLVAIAAILESYTPDLI